MYTNQCDRIHVYPWLIHVNVRQKPLQYCKVISLQLIKKKKKNYPVKKNLRMKTILSSQTNAEKAFDKI